MNSQKLLLVPQNVVDVAEQLLSKDTRSDARQNYEARLRATQEYCEEVLQKYKMKSR